MTEETHVRKRKASEEEKTEEIGDIEPKPVSSGSVWIWALKLLLGAVVVIVSLFLRGDFEADSNTAPVVKDDLFIPVFEKHIFFNMPQGVNIQCSKEYWIQRDMWNKEFKEGKNGKCLPIMCGRVVMDDLASESILAAYNYPVSLMLKEVAVLEDYKTEWDLYFNTLTDPTFTFVKPAAADNNAEDSDEEIEILAEDEEDAEAKKEELIAERIRMAQKKAEEEAADLIKRTVTQHTHGVAPIMFRQKGFGADHDSTHVWSMMLYYTQFTDLMTKIPKLIINNFKSFNFVLTYPNKFIRHSAVPDGEIPPYSKPYLVGQGYHDKRAQAKYPYVDLFAIIFLNDDYEGGEVVLTDHRTGKTSVIEPRQNRLILATAGSENIVQHKPVTKGDQIMYFLTFTCDFRRDISSPMDGEQVREVPKSQWLPYGALNVPEEGISKIFVNEATGDQYGTVDPRTNPDAKIIGNQGDKGPKKDAPSMTRPPLKSKL